MSMARYLIYPAKSTEDTIYCIYTLFMYHIHRHGECVTDPCGASIAVSVNIDSPPVLALLPASAGRISNLF